MSNMQFADVTEAMKEFKRLGQKEGEGQASRAEFMIKVAAAAAEGHITDNKPKTGDSDALKVWRAFREGAAKKAGDVVAAEASEKQRVSNVMQIIKASIIVGVDFADVLVRTRPILADAKTKELTKSNTFDAFVSVARAQLKKGDVELSDAEILGAVCPADKPEKERNEVIVLEKLIADMKRIAKGTEPTENSPGKEGYPSDALSAATQLLEDRVTLLKFSAMTAFADAARSRLIKATAR